VNQDTAVGLFVEVALLIAVLLCLYITSLIANADRPVTRRPAYRDPFGRYHGGHESTW